MTLVQDKGIGGKGEGKLTCKVINTLQNYYGMAIRRTKNTSLLQMPYLQSFNALRITAMKIKITTTVTNIVQVMAIHGANTKEAKLKVWSSKEIVNISEKFTN